MPPRLLTEACKEGGRRCAPKMLPDGVVLGSPSGGQRVVGLLHSFPWGESWEEGVHVCVHVCVRVCVHVCLSACAACGHRQVLVATAADRPTDALQLWAALPVVLGLPRSAFPTRTRSYALQTGRRCAMQAPAGQSIPVRAACISAVLLRGVSWSLVQASPGRRRQRAQLTSESKPWQALPEIAACPGACSLLWSLMQAGGPGPD